MKNLILKLCMCLGLVYLLCGTAFAAEVWDGTVADSFAGGSGTQSDPYLISNGAQLRLVDQYEYEEVFFRLTNDIYLNDTSDWENWTIENGPQNAWTPLCHDYTFWGNLDGNGHTIYGLYITNNNYRASGLFAQTSHEATIQNLSVKKSVLFGNSRVGGIVGSTLANSVIKNCHFAGKVTGHGDCIGGLVGFSNDTRIVDCSNFGAIHNDASAEQAGGQTAGIVGYAYNTVVENCVNASSVSAYGDGLGGIAGQVSYGTIFTGCKNYGVVSALSSGDGDQYCVGGIVGVAGENVTIFGCENHASVIGDASYVGGIAGTTSAINNEMNNKISACYNDAAILGSRDVGGIIGELTAGIVDGCMNKGAILEIKGSGVGGIAAVVWNGIIKNCSNEGAISGLSDEIGGIAGRSNSVINCRNTGAISGPSCVGGIVGEAVNGSKVQNCWNVGAVQVDADAHWGGMIIGLDNGCTIDHCYGLAGSCEEEPTDKEAITQVALDELKSVEFLGELNNWVREAQRPDTGYALWETDEEGYPTPTGTAPDYIPVIGILTLTQPENGSAVISATSALTEKKITVTVTPNEGYIPYQVWYCAAEEPDAVVYAEKTGKNTFSFPMPYGDAAVHATCLKLPDNPVWDGTVAAEFAGGDGTQNNPYLIGNASQLANIRNFPYAETHFRLIADIYINNTADWENWTAEKGPSNVWEPLALSSGGFDGDNYTVYGLYTDASLSDQALFSNLYGDNYIKNLTVDKSKVFGTDDVAGVVAFVLPGATISNCVNRAEIYATDDDSGGIVASLSQSKVENCINYGTIHTTAHLAGGVVGYTDGNAEIRKCINYGAVVWAGTSSNRPNVDIGGIVGYVSNGNVFDCQNYGSVSAYHSAAGIVGACSSGNIDNCANYADITAIKIADDANSGQMAGGIAARFLNGTTILNCTNDGTISGKKYVGGIAGYFYTSFGTTNKIERCSNNGTVFVGMDSEGTCVGGILGYAASGQLIIRDCYNKGDISGNRLAGGLVGQLWVSEADSSAVLETSYNTGLVTAEKYVSGIAGRICANVAGASATVRDCYTLSGVAPATVTCYGGAGRETITNAKALTAAQMGQQSSFTGFDVDTVWYSAGDGSYPVLRGEKVSVRLGDKLQVSGYLNCPLTVTADADLSDSCVYVLLVSYKDGKMEDTCMVKLTAGQSGTLDVDDWGTEVRLFALSSTYKPFCNGQTI